MCWYARVYHQLKSPGFVLQVPVHAGKSGSAISAGVPGPGYHERKIGADECLVPIQGEGAASVISLAITLHTLFRRL